MNLKTKAIQTAIYLLSRLSLKNMHRIGNVLGWLGSHSPNRVRKIAKTNIMRCFPEQSAKQQKELLRRCFQEMAKSLVEAPAFWLQPLEKLAPLIVKVSGEAEFTADLAKNKGVILLGAHMGAEELLNAYISPRYPGTWIYRPQRGYLETLVHQSRERFGSKFVPTTNAGVRALYKALHNAQVIGMSCDHNAPEQSGIFAPFFGIQTWTMTLAIRFAQKTKAPVYLVHAERLANAQGFHMHFVKVGDEIYSLDDLRAATTMNQTLETYIRLHPEQYQWAYKRFRRRPPGDAAFYV